MHVILDNPYRIIGQLVGTSLKEKTKQISRLKQYIEAEQEPPEAYSFPAIGNLDRTLDSVTDAASNLNLDHDKLNHALFWFYNGNEVTDEPAFELLKEGNIKEAGALWAKITNGKEVTEKNASAFFNLSTLMMSGSFHKAGIKEATLEKGIKLKIKFLESDFSRGLKELAADVTYQASKRAVQLMFLKQVQAEIEKSNIFSTNKLLEALSTVEFTAKDDFVKLSVARPITNIEKEVNAAAKNRNANNANALRIGTELYDDSYEWLFQLNNLLSPTNFQYTSIADKVAEEVLQCGIDYFLYYKETDTDPGPKSLELCLKAQTWATGNILKERFKDTIKHIKEWNDDEPQRANLRFLKDDLAFIDNKLDRFKNLSDSLVNAKDLVDTCKPKLMKMKKVLGQSEAFYLSVSSTIVQNSQNMIVSAINNATEGFSRNTVSKSALQTSLQSALDLTYNLRTFDMHHDNKLHFNKNLDALKSICTQVGLSTLSPKERLQQELRQAESKVNDIQRQTYFVAEINNAKSELARINEWQFMRSQADKLSQINAQQRKIDQLLTKSSQEKAAQLRMQQTRINDLKAKILQNDF